MDKLIRGLRNFQTQYFCQHRELFEQLAHGQKPRVLFIACSDSRVEPNIITQTDIGDLFVIRNAGNIVPPYGSTNGGEGASIEYAIHALNIEHVVICGHTHCGAMKGLLKLDSIRDTMPLVCDWLKHAEATRRLIRENYSTLEGEELEDLTVAENVLTQIENLKTYPVIHSRLSQKRIQLHAWVYNIETGTVMTYDPEAHGFTPVNDEHPICSIEFTPTESPSLRVSNGSPAVAAANRDPKPVYNSSWLPPEQLDRIYRGSTSRR
jgi:carbonic anhydrase